MMKKDKILLNISKIEDLSYYLKLGISNFLFPLKGYSMGYSEFDLEEIANAKVRCYVLLNRLLKSEEIDEVAKLEFPENVLGFIVEDVGIYYALKDRNYEIFLYQNHLNNNFRTVNFWLKYFDSVVLSSDITKEEVESIVSKASKPLVMKVLEYPMIMYSRRTLVSNYEHHYSLPSKKELNIKEEKANIDFFLKENEYGTAVFDNHLLDLRNEVESLNSDNIRFYYMDTHFLDKNIVFRAIEGRELDNTTTGFFSKKTVYRIGDLK